MPGGSVKEKNNSTTEHKRTEHNNILHGYVGTIKKLSLYSIANASKTKKKSSASQIGPKVPYVSTEVKNGENFFVYEPQN